MTQIIDKNTARHYAWGNHCDSWVLVDTEGLSVKQEMMPGGTKERCHFHTKAQQFFFILKGIATFYLDSEKKTVIEQSGIWVAAGIKHFIANETTDVLEFIVISQPTADNDRITISK